MCGVCGLCYCVEVTFRILVLGGGCCLTFSFGLIWLLLVCWVVGLVIFVGFVGFDVVYLCLEAGDLCCLFV